MVTLKLGVGALRRRDEARDCRRMPHYRRQPALLALMLDDEWCRAPKSERAMTARRRTGSVAEACYAHATTIERARRWGHAERQHAEVASYTLYSPGKSDARLLLLFHRQKLPSMMARDAAPGQKYAVTSTSSRRRRADIIDTVGNDTRRWR